MARQHTEIIVNDEKDGDWSTLNSHWNCMGPFQWCDIFGNYKRLHKKINNSRNIYLSVTPHKHGFFEIIHWKTDYFKTQTIRIVDAHKLTKCRESVYKVDAYDDISSNVLLATLAMLKR